MIPTLLLTINFINFRAPLLKHHSFGQKFIDLYPREAHFKNALTKK